MELIMGGAAAAAAGLFTNPLDVIKIRMQLQGELKSKGKYTIHYRNVFHAGYTIARRDGLLALQKGLAPGLCYQFVMNGIRLGVYDILDKRGFTRNNDRSLHPFKSMIVAAFAGILGASVGSPFFLLKTHLQSKTNEASIAVGHQHQHHGMISGFKSIYHKYGVLGLWRGLSSTMPRLIVASSVQLSTFETSLVFVKKSPLLSSDSRWINAFNASLISGLFVSIAMAPFDLIATRFYNQGVDASGKGLTYKSVWDCGKKIFLQEGFLGYYKGWSANYFRLGPHTVLSLVFWDQLKHHYHLSSLNDDKRAL